MSIESLPLPAANIVLHQRELYDKYIELYDESMKWNDFGVSYTVDQEFELGDTVLGDKIFVGAPDFAAFLLMREFDPFTEEAEDEHAFVDTITVEGVGSAVSRSIYCKTDGYLQCDFVSLELCEAEDGSPIDIEKFMSGVAATIAAQEAVDTVIIKEQLLSTEEIGFSVVHGIVRPVLELPFAELMRSGDN